MQEAAMKVMHDTRHFERPAAVVSIGMYDGVHRGHRRVLRALRAEGRKRALPTLVLTFDPHPRALLQPARAPALLVSLAHRLQLLAATGAVDHCAVLPFDRQRSEQSAEDFVAHTLVGELHMRALVVGANFGCGCGRSADIQRLAELGRELGFDVLPIELLAQGAPSTQRPCSSTEMRRLIETGEIALAAEGLQRPHEMTATVLQPLAGGHAIELGLPPGFCTPAAADYAGSVRNRHAASPWVPAWLQVQHRASAPQRSTVHLVARGQLPAARGDQLALRFHARSPA
jgi:riboflavin kinase/FMN adenylyltransferase